MIDELREMAPRQAAGILSRAALAIETGGLNPAARPRTSEEANIRDRIIESFRTSFQRGGRNEPQWEEWLLQRLDEAASELDVSRDEPAALERLTLSGVLPSDAYDVSFDPALDVRLFAHLPDGERQRVLATIRSPAYEEVFAPSITPDAPSPVSMFANWFELGRPRDRFLLVVVAQRRAKKDLLVNHSWRVYPSDVNVRQSKTLADVIERFAEVYGLDIKIANWQGRFLRYMLLSAPSAQLTLSVPNEKGLGMLFVTKRHPTPQTTELAFGIGIDLNRYFSDVHNHEKFAMR